MTFTLRRLFGFCLALFLIVAAFAVGSSDAQWNNPLTGRGNAFGVSSLTACQTVATSYSTCNDTASLGVTMLDTNYTAVCQGVGTVTGFPHVMTVAKSTTSLTITIVNGAGNGAAISGYPEVDCLVSGS